MKKVILVSALMLSVTFVIAQDRTKEVGLSFRNLDGFGLNYKVGKQNALWRLNSGFSQGYRSEELYGSNIYRSTSFNAAFNAGREFRKHLTDDFVFRYGFDLSFSYSRSKNEYRDARTSEEISHDKSIQYRPGVNGVIGVNYLIGEHFLVGGELLPGLGYSTGTRELHPNSGETLTTDLSGFDFSISSSSVLFVIAYRF